MAEFALVIGQQSVHLYRLSRAAAEHVVTVEPWEDLSACLAQHLPMQANCSLVSDFMDESYLRSTLPPIWLAGTRQQLLQRRLMQQLRDTSYRAAVLTPSGSWRPPTRACMLGLGQGERERIVQWLAALAARQVRVKGLWPLSALIALAVDQKAARRPRTDTAREYAEPPASLRLTLALVATPAGLRQVLIRGKTPQFSRLSISADAQALTASAVLSEARRTVQYLISQDWLSSADQPVATQMWLPFDDAQALAGTSADPVLDVQSIETVPDAYARLLPGLKSVSAQLQFLPDESRTLWRAARIANTAKALGLAALLASGLWSADLLWAALGQRNLARQQVASAAAINQQAREEVLRAKGDLSQAGLAVATVQAWQQSVAAQPDQFAALQHLAVALQTAPGIEVQKIQWQLPPSQPQVAGAPVEAAAPFACPGPPAPLAGTAAAPPAPNAEAVPPEAAKPAAALLNLVAALPLNVTRRQALALQGRLLASLNAGGWRAVIVKSGVALDPAQLEAGTLGAPGERALELCLQKAAK
ncbi:MAG: hypothetical protein ACYCZ6_09905 [Polaromonas sp.]